jgi:hypothetical protein
MVGTFTSSFGEARRELMFRPTIAVFAAMLFTGPSVTTAQSPTPGTTDDTFIWHGELVSVDAATGTFTIKANMLAESAGEVARFKPGDRVLVTWSGVDRYAGAVRQITKYDGNGKVTDPFAFPVELASSEAPNGYVTIKFRAPTAAVQAVASVKPGEWVTVTTRRHSSGDAQGIVSIAPYVKPASNT